VAGQGGGPVTHPVTGSPGSTRRAASSPVDHHGTMSPRAALPALAVTAAVAVAACGSTHQASPATSAGSTTSSTSAGSTTTGSTSPTVTAQPATTAPPGLGPASPLGSTQSVTTPEGHTLGVRVSEVSPRSATQTQVQVQLTADGPPSQVQPASDFRVIDSAGARFGASLTAAPAGCPALPASVTVTAQQPVSGCLVFVLPSGVPAAQVTFTAEGAPATSAVAWRAS
jgi:hypothetical protein